MRPRAPSASRPHPLRACSVPFLPPPRGGRACAVGPGGCSSSSAAAVRASGLAGAGRGDGRRPGLRDGRCGGLGHVPHAVLGAAQERLRGAQGPPLQDRGDEHLQNGQARPRQGAPGGHRHLHGQEVRGHLSVHPQHGRAQHQTERLPAHWHPGRVPVAAPGQRGGAGGSAAAGGGAGPGDRAEIRLRRGDPDHGAVGDDRGSRCRDQSHGQIGQAAPPGSGRAPPPPAAAAGGGGGGRGRWGRGARGEGLKLCGRGWRGPPAPPPPSNPSPLPAVGEGRPSKGEGEGRPQAPPPSLSFGSSPFFAPPPFSPLPPPPSLGPRRMGNK